MANYAPSQPRDKGGDVKINYPSPIVAKFTTSSAPPSVSSVVSFGSNTTEIEVTALNSSLAIKWGSGSVIGAAGSTANFDHIVPVNSTRRFVIPVSTTGASSSVVGANASNGLYSTMAVIATTSVLSAYTEY